MERSNHSNYSNHSNRAERPNRNSAHINKGGNIRTKMISVVYTAVCEGIEGIPVQVETDIGPGLPQINIVGLASTTVMESRERIKSGLLNSGFEYPRRRVTVNLIPAGIRKNGSHLDLAIAMGILGAMGYADADALREIGFIGEISLQGDVCRVEGVLPMILGMEKAGIRRVVLPAENLAEAELAREGGSAGPELLAVRNLQECLDAVQGKKIPSQGERVRPAIRETEYADFSDISGQENAKRAAVIVVAGHHGLLMMGSPGCGKTMIARRIPSILPPLTRQQMVETTMIYSIAGKLEKGQEIISAPPFRHPHHSIGKAGLLGGGSYPVPGEITMAHNGVLFLDEVGEFKRENIEALRIPLEEGEITHFRHGRAYRFPSDFRLVMATNPCPCGYLGDPERECRCSPGEIENYRKRLSGPMLERMDMLIQMEKVHYDELNRKPDENLSSKEMRKMVMQAIDFAAARGQGKPNGLLEDREVQQLEISAEGREILQNAYTNLKLSPRTWMKVQKVARTIADAEQSECIEGEHILEALSYRTAPEDIY